MQRALAEIGPGTTRSNHTIDTGIVGVSEEDILLLESVLIPDSGLRPPAKEMLHNGWLDGKGL
ncbi:hypothetical protein PABG_12323 [Paracoccidioides brasiliensis Pb03]|uniref:Uncharacterized protein n=1 Tax=Paracoccidioides brasiliensis (strain Pb18) TaxID=502780 RepID=C1GK17_PARBD|nr:uncharacterized protein PADG_07603 [Paracoccidioides brasiliensis Pb18]EEH42783.2 hypothetical protein PADG_07603 [Paracoccidioides brasiliensis Pb18]KGY14829.1 hypothetical protein PABG_12323 [Paracoccidioides brasiliensis Pb03]ODH53791.1 hypothetical protein GX48_00209 [Paracoccidioides brasiliensis]